MAGRWIKKQRGPVPFLVLCDIMWRESASNVSKSCIIRQHKGPPSSLSALYWEICTHCIRWAVLNTVWLTYHFLDLGSIPILIPDIRPRLSREWARDKVFEDTLKECPGNQTIQTCVFITCKEGRSQCVTKLYYFMLICFSVAIWIVYVFSLLHLYILCSLNYFQTHRIFVSKCTFCLSECRDRGSSPTCSLSSL